MKRRYQAVEVFWDDAASSQGWESNKSARQWANGRYICRSVGLLVRDSKRGVTIALSENCYGGFGDLLRIPRGMVLKVKVLVRAGR